MKRLFVLSVVLSILMSLVSARAPGQKRVMVGVRVGATASTIISDTPTGNWVNRRRTIHWGYTVGLVTEFRVVRMFSIQPELLLTLKGSSSSGDAVIQRANDPGISSIANENQSQNLTYVELPLKMVLKIPIGRNTLNIAAGPYAAFGVDGVQRSSYFRDGVNIDDEMTELSREAKLFRGDNRLYRPWDVGLAASLGWEFDFGLFLDAGYSHGLITMDTTRRYRDFNSSASLSVGVKF
jgi:hypothetical protein